MRRHRLVVIAVLILSAALGAALPVAARGPTPPFFTSGSQMLVDTASSGGQPQSANSDGQYFGLATADFPMPARILADGQVVCACQRPVKLPPQLRQSAPARSRIDPPDQGVCVTRPGQPCPRLPRADQ